MDRISGGVTLLLHIDGNQAPGTKLVPEAVKVQAYITPHIKMEIAGGDVAVARIVQMFVESIALPSIKRWQQAMANIG